MRRGNIKAGTGRLLLTGRLSLSAFVNKVLLAQRLDPFVHTLSVAALTLGGRSCVVATEIAQPAGLKHLPCGP